MKEKILEIIQQLKHGDWKIRNQAYLNLMDLSDPGVISIFWEVMDRANDMIVIYFCRWISKNMSIQSQGFSMTCLLELMGDSRPRISKEAMFSVEKILRSDDVKEKNKIDMLIEILLHGTEEGKKFAARIVAKYIKIACGPMLSYELGQSASPSVRLACVDALRELQDTRGVLQLEKCLEDQQDTDVLYAVIFALGDLGFSSWKKIRPFLNDKRVTIRHVAIWAIGRLGQKEVLKDLVLVLQSDTSSTCQIEACKRLGKIQDPRVIPILLEVSVLNGDQNVKNMALFCLDQIDRSIAFKKYYELRNNVNEKVRAQLFMQLAKTKHKKAFSYLSHVLLVEKNHQLQAAAAEALAQTDNKDAVGVLKKALWFHPSVSYSAMLSLVQLMDSKEMPFVVELLKDPKTPKMTQQLLLKHLEFRVKDKKVFFTQPLIEVLFQKLSSQDINIAYLAVIVLGESYDLSAIVPLFQLSMNAHNAHVRLKAQEAIENIIEGDLSLLIKLLDSRFVDESLHQEILKSLSLFQCKAVHKTDTLLKLLILMEGAKEADRLSFLSSLGHIIGEDMDLILKILSQTTWSDRLMRDILDVIQGLVREDDPKNSILPLAALTRALGHPLNDIRKIAVRILEKVSQHEALESLCAMAYQDPDPKVSQYARVAVRSIVNQRHL